MYLIRAGKLKTLRPWTLFLFVLGNDHTTLVDDRACAWHMTSERVIETETLYSKWRADHEFLITPRTHWNSEGYQDCTQYILNNVVPRNV
jgi:hypothetical protein